MTSPKIDTFRQVVPWVYSWRTPDLPKYRGWEKIGYTAQQSVDDRIAQQASQLKIAKEKVWAFRAMFLAGDAGRFTDREFHAYLKQQGVQREPGSEWHNFNGTPHASRDYILKFAARDFTPLQTDGADEYILRPEQQAAVDQAVAAFTGGRTEVLWNAKPRFGKTLTTYDLIRTLGLQKVLIVTNRPAIANSWFDDFVRFIGHQTTYKFVSESESLSQRTPMTRAQWRAHSRDRADARIIEFVSLQDLKGSVYFGGPYRKLKHIADFDWDLLVIDESHEGVDTIKTDIAVNQIRRPRTLYLSGTPFKALASGQFPREAIFNWTYEDEQAARAAWHDGGQENPYDVLPTLNLLTYQLSRMITDRLAEGVAIDEEQGSIDYAFDLNEFFATKDNGYFKYEDQVRKFLDCLTTNEKYPFSTPELRDEVRHSFWLLNRVASAKALEKLLKAHPVFQEYTIVLAAGDGKVDDADPAAIGKSLDKVRAAIEAAENSDGKTITLSVGQLTTGVTIPEWTAVIMLSNLATPAGYMQAAFRAQNPCTFVRGDTVYQKQNAYIFDFAPERTLTIFDAFANNLSPNPSGDPAVRQDNIRRLLNFFPVLGEDSEGRMIELDASQVLTFPQVFKAREVVRRGFLSNLLFDNIAGIFRFSSEVKDILDKLTPTKHGKLKKSGPIEMPEPLPVTDRDGNAQIDAETVINPKVAELGPPVWSIEDIPPVTPDTPASLAAAQIAKAVTQRSRPSRDKLKDEYGLTAAQTDRDIKRTEQNVKDKVERAYAEHTIARKHLDAELEAAATEADAVEVQAKVAEQQHALTAEIHAIAAATMDQILPDVIQREETKKEQKRADTTMDTVRDHLRGFARTIPMFLMAYGQRGTRLANFDEYTPEDVFEEITGITEAEFRTLRDGQQVTNDDGTTVTIPGLFDEAVFDQSIQEFLNKKEELADYFDDALTEDIFAYIPQQRTSLVFTPKPVVQQMVDILEAQNPGIFEDPTKTFADLFSTAGLFLMELVRRLDTGLAEQIPDQHDRLKHILTTQIFEMSHNTILHAITIEAVSGGVAERKQWMNDSGHYRVGDLARMSVEDRQKMVDETLSGRP